jgi:hypothetical protein
VPSQIEQREGRIERQGNAHDEIEIYAYATKRSVDATGWQILERKARFIDAAMSGDRSVRRIEDAGSQANQFALAKAIASGDERLMRQAGSPPRSRGSNACATAISTISSRSGARLPMAKRARRGNAANRADHRRSCSPRFHPRRRLQDDGWRSHPH